MPSHAHLVESPHHVTGENEKVNFLLGYTLKYLTIASFSFLFAVHAFGAWVLGGVLGEQYLSVVDNLKVFALGLLPLALVRTGFSMATVHRQPSKILRTTAPSLVTFIVAAAILVPHAGSYGAASAVALALAVAGVITFYQFPLNPVLAAANYWRHVLFGLAAMGILVVPSFSVIPMGLIAIMGFFVLLFVGKVISIGELRQIYQARVAH